MNENNVATGSARAWLLAARPKTLTGAAVPVMLGSSLAFHDHGCVRLLPMLLCFLFAFLMQIDANFVNDYYDCVKGTDNEERLGPKRACSQGWIRLGDMKKGIALTTLLSCLVGLPLVLFGGWNMIWVGIACVVFCFLYTTCLSYWGLGDLLVLVFFGLVPVCITYCLVSPCDLGLHVPRHVAWPSVACGLVIDALLVVNNYRDIDNDRRSGKRTLVVRIGRRATEALYLALGLAAFAIHALAFQGGWATAFLLVYVLFHIDTYRCMCRIARGTALNVVLGKTARNIFIFGVATSMGLLLEVI